MTYEELFQRYNETCAENERLLAENRKLRKRWGIEEQTEGIDVFEAKVTKYSSVDEKLDLFMSLFVGRTDVYAKRWYSLKSEKSGYQPVCENEWSELCNKQQYKCSNCPNRKLSPLDRQAIFEHLSGKDKYGRDVIGIYPMLADETCRFLAVDFDDADFKEASLAFKNTCAQSGIPAYIERSRSGDGAHVWIFFSEPIEAAVARKLGSGLLTLAMDNQSKIKFNSYDRLFPNQDTMPKGGFGNLIALPLQGLARKNNNSEFVDDNFISYPDQWAFLSTVEQISTKTVANAVDKICPKNELGVLTRDSEEKTKPWETKDNSPLTHIEFSGTVNIVRANMLYIEKQNLSHRVVNRIRRLAAFKNPDFYKAQAMRLPIYNKPRIISAVDETEEYLSIPRGCEDELITLLDSANALYTTDKRGLIYDGRSFLSVYNSDLKSASHEIVIVNPFMRKNRVSQFIKLLLPIAQNGVSVTVVTRPPEDFKEDEQGAVKENLEVLEQAGTSVKTKSNFHQKFTIIDNATVWYGSVNFLSFGSHEESIMRFESADIASELLETVE